MHPDPTRTTDQRLRAAVESSPSGILMSDAEGQIVLVNREIERLFGYVREELLGKPVELLVPARFHGHHSQDRRDFTTSPKVRAMGAGRELRGRRKDGTEVPLEVGLTPVITEEGLFVLASVVDISARVEAERNRRELEEQLRQSQKLEAVGTLAGGIAHDFRNILNGIIGYAELLAKPLHGRQEAADLAQLRTYADRGRQLVDRILTFSRRSESVRQPVRLSASIDEVTGLLRSTLPSTIDIRLDVRADAPPVMADPTSVHQVLMNLCTNAAHAMVEGGMLSIAVEPLYVRDSMARANPRPARGAVRPPDRPRHRLRHRSRRGLPGVRPVLHHQARRLRHRARPGSGARHHEEPRRRGAAGQHPARRHRGPLLLPRRRGGADGAGGGRPRGRDGRR
ncbi:MAG: PAS domain S-box protein [Gemmatimonadetes bacterium]|nr:PAS domain S-box protein [Gemmatimonadota bacterium]